MELSPERELKQFREQLELATKERNFSLVGTPLPESTPIHGAVNSRIAFDLLIQSPKRGLTVSKSGSTVKIFGQNVQPKSFGRQTTAA